MSSTPSLTQDSFYSDLPYSPLTEITELSEDVSDPTDHWSHNAGQPYSNYVLCHANPDQQSDFSGHVDEQPPCMSHELHGGALRQTEGCGAWMGEQQMQASSSQRPGLLDAQNIYPALHNASGINVPPFPAGYGPYATIYPSQHPTSTSTATTASSKVEIPRLPRKMKAAKQTFICSVCKITISRDSDLKRHIKNHWKGHGHACGNCSHKARRLDRLKEHCRKKHKEAHGHETYEKCACEGCTAL